jgi:uncharacterized protein YjbI with pentapeptide repeats
MKKFELKTLAGEVAFTWESENNTIKETVEKFLKENIGKIIKNINFSDMDLSTVSFDNSRFDNSSFDNSSFYNSSFDNSSFYNSSFYNSSFYNSSFDNSSFDNSRFDNSSFDNSSFYNSSFDAATVKNIRDKNQLYMFDTYKADFWSILLKSQSEIAGLKKALQNGKVDGSTYTGECACLVGTIANIKKCNHEQIPNIKPDSNRPAEKWFLGIRKGDTPETSEMSKLTLEWIEEFESYLPKTI